MEFLYDAYGGSADTDRNLNLVGASYDGKDINGASADLLRPGVASFSFYNETGPAALRILPLGDSNTHGYDNSKNEALWESYRQPLWDLAIENGFSIDFVGSRSNGSAALPDRDHFGISGITATEVATFAGDLARETLPDVVLLMLGTNDAMREGDAAQTVPGELLSIIRSIASVAPDVDIFLASLPPIDAALLPFRADPNEIRDAINARLPGVVAEAKSEGIDATFVPINYTMDDLTDGVHLSEAAHARTAHAWFDAVFMG